jgi:NAD(P)-dependent dehydrogenase (short-subunit alcohol dehydrogenase family)
VRVKTVGRQPSPSSGTGSATAGTLRPATFRDAQLTLSGGEVEPLAKTVGEPEQIAAAHLYLMDNRFVTGTVLTVDGGAVLT